MPVTTPGPAGKADTADTVDTVGSGIAGSAGAASSDGIAGSSGAAGSDGSADTGIHGVWTRPLSVIPTAGGPVLHMLRADNPQFAGFGEIYFSEVLPGAIKAWKRHLRQAQYFAVPAGRVEFVIYDDRQESVTRSRTVRVTLGRPDAYRLLHVPPGLWYGFTGLADAPSLIANCADMPHDPDEAERLPFDHPGFPAVWKSPRSGGLS